MDFSGRQRVTDVAEDAKLCIQQHLKVRGKSLTSAVQKSRKRLPRHVKKSAEKITHLQERMKHLPYVSPSDLAEVEKESEKIRKFAAAIDLKADRKAARKKWATSLFLSYSGFLVLLGAFWYISTQM